MRFKDLTGKKFGRWTAISPIKNKYGRFSWKCICDCGEVRTIGGTELSQGNSTSCGCLRKERFTKFATKHGYAVPGSVSKEYRVWCSMKRRCYSKKDKSYPRYGGRGITVCDRWKDSFQNFIDDMGDCPPKMSIERKNNSQGYSPKNCEWADAVAQANNKRNNRIVTINGKAMTVAQWARSIGIKLGTAHMRLYRERTKK